MTNHHDQVVHYYESCEEDYRLLWDLDRSMAMHAGYWDETTRSLPDALMRENEILAQKVQIKEKDHVLDAGCGMGGSCFYLAQKYGCRVTGITLSQKQVKRAKEHAKKLNLQDKTQFHVMDYCNTTLPENSFDVVWGLESVCHAGDKAQFIREAYRLLKDKGRLIIADGFTMKRSYSQFEQRLMKKWLNGWGVNTLETVEDFQLHLKKIGFSNIAYQDITSHVLPSSRRLFFYSLPAYPLSRMGEIIGKRSKIQTNNILSAFYQYRTLRRGLWKYGIFYAEK